MWDRFSAGSDKTKLINQLINKTNDQNNNDSQRNEF